MKKNLKRSFAACMAALTMIAPLSFQQGNTGVVTPITASAITIQSGFTNGTAKKIANGVTLYFTFNESDKSCEVIGSKITNEGTTVKIPAKVTKNGIKYTVKSIGHFAFHNQTNIVKVTGVPSKLVDGAFYNCSNLEEIKGAASDYIGGSAFKGCSALTDISFAQNARFIGAHAFWDCTGIKAITIKKAETLGEAAFYNCSGAETIKITSSALTVIAPFAFTFCRSAQSISLPPNLTEIGKQAFQDCDELLDVYMPEYISVISTGAFMNCDSLREVNMAAPSMRYFLNGLKYLTDPDNAVSISMTFGDHAFFNCPNLNRFSYISSKFAEHNIPFEYPYAEVHAAEDFTVTVGDYFAGWYIEDNMLKQVEGFWIESTSGEMWDYMVENGFDGNMPVSC